eukprot:TRINITY_DN1291_c0_g1_i1.p1 TRINITY_DN1291_c0_g1~~TRINITY_DN1291_c0_g1_i1.p1  ORF type:complete len:313 (+),score=47.24 TRINITY_DN1291_c0_g1_i1:89-1027(+)
MLNLLREKKKVLDYNGKPTYVPPAPRSLFGDDAAKRFRQIVSALSIGEERKPSPLLFSRLLDGYLVLDRQEGTLSKPEDGGILRGWDMDGVKRRKECLGWVKQTRREELVANYLGTRSFCFATNRSKIWIIDKSVWLRCRDDWLMGHILAYSTNSSIHCEMLGRVEDAQRMELEEELSKRERASLGERKAAFLALGILLNMTEGRLARRMREHLKSVGDGGDGAREIKEFLIGASHEGNGRNADLLNWYCKGADAWITGRATRGSEEVNEGAWFVRMGKSEDSDQEEEPISESFFYECNSSDEEEGRSSGSD